MQALQPPRSVLDYHAAQAPRVASGTRRFLVIYAIGIAAAYCTVWYCAQTWPHNSNGADIRKAELAMTIQVAGGAACAWLVLGLRRILIRRTLRRNVWSWLLVAANAFVGLTALPMGYQ